MWLWFELLGLRLLVVCVDCFTYCVWVVGLCGCYLLGTVAV